MKECGKNGHVFAGKPCWKPVFSVCKLCKNWHDFAMATRRKRKRKRLLDAYRFAGSARWKGFVASVTRRRAPSRSRGSKKT